MKIFGLYPIYAIWKAVFPQPEIFGELLLGLVGDFHGDKGSDLHLSFVSDVTKKLFAVADIRIKFDPLWRGTVDYSNDAFSLVCLTYDYLKRIGSGTKYTCDFPAGFDSV